jgi:AcrR family transcriptional regulator
MTPPEAPEIRWIRPPQQGRSAKTLERLLNATEQLLNDRDFESISVAEIVKAASSSVGSFYGRFDNKAAVLHALHDRYDEEARMTAAQALAPEVWDGVPLGEIIERFCEFLVIFQREHWGVRRALVLHNGTSTEHRKRSRGLAKFVIDLLANLLESRRDELGHPDPEVAAEMLHRIAFSVLDQEVMFNGESPTDGKLELEGLTRELARACVGLLEIRG